MNRNGFTLAALSSILILSQSHAVVLYRSATRNTSAPTGAYLNSGWQYQVQFNTSTGTVVAPNVFATAAHVNPPIGSTVTWNGTTHTIVNKVELWGTDVSYCVVAESFPHWSPMYDEATDGAFAGKEIVVMGRGTQRGEELYLPTPPRPGESTFRGWRMGTFDSVQAWGTNVIGGYESELNQDPKEYFYFDLTPVGGTPEECMVSTGDSGGGAFARGASGIWKMVGVATTVDGLFRLNESDTRFRGAMIDYGNLWVGDDFVPDTVADQPSRGYFTNLTHYLDMVRPYIPTDGDANLDGKVNTLDFNLLAGKFGETTPNWADGDFSHDGVVDSIDFGVMMNHYGSVTTPPSGVSSSSSLGANVPEPASALALGVFGVALLTRRRQF